MTGSETEAERSAKLSRLVAAARRGDAVALDALFRQFAPVVHGILLGYVQKADADDLTQDVFETVIERLNELREDAAFPGWIVTIARRTALSMQRRNVVAMDVSAERLIAVDDPTQRADAHRALQAIRKLPPAYREPLILRLVQGLSGQEIAALTGLTPGSVRVNLHRGMTMLRASLAIQTEEA